MFFESVWDTNMRRWIDLCSESAYDINDSTARCIFDIKLLQLHNFRESLPAFAFYEEDDKIPQREMERQM